MRSLWVWTRECVLGCKMGMRLPLKKRLGLLVNRLVNLMMDTYPVRPRMICCNLVKFTDEDQLDFLFKGRVT